YRRQRQMCLRVRSSTFHFPGHTEYLQAIAGDEYKALMILACEHLRVALVTTHIPLANVAKTLTTDMVYDKIEQFDKALRRDFGIVRPRIAVLGLNPHAGDEGVIGNEEPEIITPAIQRACENRIEAYGPYAADGFFGSGAFKHFDGVLAMYHDQGLIPFKTLAMGQGVNITSGLPFVRTSPDHGTAFDIAGKGIADPRSMRQAIYAACDIIRNRQRYDEMTSNPLRKQYFDRSKDNVVLDLTSD
ncbi:MAG: 4-hydroxythreonine-4-phosphate dehydrogenase PdxA, partial [Muribaculaceae bacterium]|nr:4-hydroxythreonine-4-phosphate dehydrogenase PdxA [Muribaculaceae bacterium]